MLKKFTSILSLGLICAASFNLQAGETLDRVNAKKVLKVATNSDWAPQAFLNKDNQMDGFDVDVAKEVAKRLGASAEFVTPGWEVMTAGRWSGRWDIVIGSMTPTKKRTQILDFPAVYYYTPAVFATHKDSTAKTVEDLNGKVFGVPPSSTFHLYLEKKLVIEAQGVPAFDFKVTPGEIKTYGAGLSEFDDLRLGNGVRLDAILQAQPGVEAAIKKGLPLKTVGKPVFYEPLAIATDKGDEAFNQKISDAISAMREDGTLKSLSEKWYSVDYTVAR